MKKPICLIGLILLLLVSFIAAQEQEKEFKSILGDVKDAKEARWIITPSYNFTGMIYAGIEADFDEYVQNQKVAKWLVNGQCAMEDLRQFKSKTSQVFEHLKKAAGLLDFITKEGQIPVMVSQSISEKENGTYKGTLEDVKKAEEHIFKADQLNKEISDSPVCKLIKKDREEQHKKN